MTPRRESGDLEVGDIAVKMSASAQEDGRLFQQHVLNGISDEDFIAEMQRRMGAANPEITQAVQREIDDNKVLDKESLVDIFSSIAAETERGAVENNKISFDQAVYRKMRSIPDLTNLKSENFLQSLNSHDNNHYQEIAQSISEKIQSLEAVTMRDLKSIINEEYQSDHALQRQQSLTKKGGR